MAEQLTDERLKELGQAIQEFFDCAKFGHQERVMLWIREQLGPKAFTPDDVLSLVREVQRHRMAPHVSESASTEQDVLKQAYRSLSRAISQGDHMRAEAWARVIATLRQDPMSPNVRVSGAGAKADITVNPGAPSTSTKPGLKQETLGADATCTEPGCTAPRGMASLYNPDWKCPRHRRQGVPLGEAAARSWDAAHVTETETGRTTVSIRQDDAPGQRYGITVPLDVIRPVLPMLEALMNGEDLKPDACPAPEQLAAFVAALTPQPAKPVYVVRPEAGPISDLERAAQVADTVAKESSAMASDARGASNEALAKCYDQQVATAESVARRIRNLEPRSAPVEPKTDGAPKPGMRDDLRTVKEALSALYECGGQRWWAKGTCLHGGMQALERVTHGVSLLQAVAQAVNDVLSEARGAWPRLYEAVQALDEVK
jgi:hypothetical protein